MADPDAAPPVIGTVVATADRTIDPKTGEPRRPVVIWIAAGLFFAAAAVVFAGLLWAFWLSVRTFEQAAWLNGVTPTAPGDLVRVGLVTAMFTIAMLIGAACVVAGHYAWKGYRWTRWAGLVAAAASAGALVINPLASAGIAAAVIAAVLLWLPPSRRFFAAWHTRRHPEPAVPEIADDVFYGPLPKYR